MPICPIFETIMEKIDICCKTFDRDHFIYHRIRVMMIIWNYRRYHHTK